MKNSLETPHIIPNTSQKLKTTSHKGLICINYSLKQLPQCINYFNDFNLFTKQSTEIPLSTNNNFSNNKEIVPFHKKTNYNLNEFFDNTPQSTPPPPDNNFTLEISNDIEDFVKFIQSGKDLFNKIHYTRVKRLSLRYKKNLQNKERIDEMILKLSTILNEKKDVIKEWLNVEVKALKLESMYSYFIKAFGRYLSSLNKTGINYDALKIADQRDKISVDLRKTTQNKIDKCINLGIDFLKYLNEHSYLIITIKKLNPSVLSIVMKAKTLKNTMYTKINDGYTKWKIKIDHDEIERIFFQNWNDQLEYYADVIYNNNIEYFYIKNIDSNNNNIFQIEESVGNNINTNGISFNTSNQGNSSIFGKANNISNQDSYESNFGNLFVCETAKSNQINMPPKSNRYKIKNYDFNDF